MIKGILAAIATVTVTAALAIGAASFSAAPAHAAAKPASWQQVTCSAFATWQRKRTAGNLDALVTGSLHLPHGYLAADVLELAATVVAARPKQHHVDTSAEYVAQDCYGGL